MDCCIVQQSIYQYILHGGTRLFTRLRLALYRHLHFVKVFSAFYHDIAPFDKIADIRIYSEAAFVFCTEAVQPLIFPPPPSVPCTSSSAPPLSHFPPNLMHKSLERIIRLSPEWLACGHGLPIRFEAALLVIMDLRSFLEKLLNCKILAEYCHFTHQRETHTDFNHKINIYQ